jgi:peptidoglycan/LPS O-acetylase OafA/YrhL
MSTSESPAKKGISFQRKDQHLSLKYISGLDGIRAISVIAVIFYHANFSWALGGYLGVETFFVISGYLITSLLINEWNSSGGINLLRFWLKRARRLLPALWLLIVTLAITIPVLARDGISNFLKDIPPALFYYTNWAYIFRNTSYFETFGRPPLLKHLWSLAIEEQFYLFWPIILFLLLKVFGNRKRKNLLYPILVLVVISTLWMSSLFTLSNDASRVYFGTDTRAAGLLIGACLATLWQPWKESHQKPRKTWLIDILGWGLLILISYLFVTLNEFNPYLYHGGITLFSLASAGLIFAATHSETSLSRFLEIPIMRWLGTRSYGIYLWHFPVFMMSRSGSDVNLPVIPLFAIQLSLTLLIAEASYRWIELPIRKIGFRSFATTVKTQFIKKPYPFFITIIVFVLYTFSMTNFGKELLSRTFDTNSVYFQISSSDQITTNGLPDSQPSLPGTSQAMETQTPQSLDAADVNSQATTLPPTLSTQVEQQVQDTDIVLTQTTEKLQQIDYTFIGDSVMEGVSEMLLATFGENIYIDTEKSRNVEDGPEIIDTLAEEGNLAPIVIIHLGTNRLFEEDHFQSLLETLANHQVTQIYIINVRRPIRWESLANKRLKEGVSSWDQAILLDWYTKSDNKPGYFGEDEVHLTTYGKKAYLNLIQDTIAGNSD